LAGWDLPTLSILLYEVRFLLKYNREY
jgi:hypothetical protein